MTPQYIQSCIQKNMYKSGHPSPRCDDVERTFQRVASGVSMITVVAFTIATANCPGSRPGALTDSLLISETT